MNNINEGIYILYSPDIIWDWSSNIYPKESDGVFEWSPNFIPVKENSEGNLVAYHMWMKFKVGEGDIWTSPMKITNPVLSQGNKGDDGIQGIKGDVGNKGAAGISIEVEYADINKNLVSGTSNSVIFVRFKKDPYSTSEWFKIVGSDAIISETFPMGDSGQILSTNGVSAIWIEQTDIYNDNDARSAVIDDTLSTAPTYTYSIDKLLSLFADGSLHNHDDRYYTETELDVLLLTKKDVFTENTGFNLDLGTIGGTVAEGNHSHDDIYYTETEINVLFDSYYTRAELNAGQLDNRYYTETELNTDSSAEVHWDNLTNIPDLMVGLTAVSPLVLTGNELTHLDSGILTTSLDRLKVHTSYDVSEGHITNVNVTDISTWQNTLDNIDGSIHIQYDPGSGLVDTLFKSFAEDRYHFFIGVNYAGTGVAETSSRSDHTHTLGGITDNVLFDYNGVAMAMRVVDGVIMEQGSAFGTGMIQAANLTIEIGQTVNSTLFSYAGGLETDTFEVVFSSGVDCATVNPNSISGTATEIPIRFTATTTAYSIGIYKLIDSKGTTLDTIEITRNGVAA